MLKFYLKTAAVAVLVLFVFALQAQTPFYTNDFSDGALPSGWSTDDLAGQGVTWTWCGDPDNTGAGCVANWDLYMNQHGAFMSSTAGNGFVLADSDAAGALPTNHQSILTSAAIDCSAQTEVWVKFESMLGVYDNPTLGNVFLQVSTDSSTWTSYDLFDIAPGNQGNEPGSIRWTLNPQVSVVDISAQAAGQATVYLRWFWEGNYEYYWLLDDLALYPEDPTTLFFPANDLRVNSNFFAIAPNAIWPLSQAETFGFLADVENVGLVDQTNVNLNITVTDLADNSTVYTEDMGYGTIPADSLVENMLFPNAGFLPTDMTAYEGVYTITADSMDQNPDNNTQTFQFLMNDTLFAKEAGANRPIYPAAGGWDSPTDPRSWAYGNVYYVVDGTDLYARTVSFALLGEDPINNTSVAGETVQVRLYKWEDSDGDGDIQSSERTILGVVAYTIQGTETQDDVITMPITSLTGDPIALESNTQYLVIIEYETTTQTAIWFGASDDFDYGAMNYRSEQLGAPRYAGALGIAASLTDETYSTLGFGFDFVPVVRLSVGDALTVGTNDLLSENNKLTVFPNPVSDKVNLSMDLSRAFDRITLSLMDANGKILEVRNLQNVQQAVETFDVSTLPAGSYILQLNSTEGSRSLPFQVVK